MANSILVTPQKLYAAADEFNGSNNQVKALTQQMIETVNSLKSTWAGEAATAYNSKFMQLQDDMTKFSAMIQEHATDLQQMAKNYEMAETSNIEAANALAGDVIS